MRGGFEHVPLLRVATARERPFGRGGCNLTPGQIVRAQLGQHGASYATLGDHRAGVLRDGCFNHHAIDRATGGQEQAKGQGKGMDLQKVEKSWCSSSLQKR